MVEEVHELPQEGADAAGEGGSGPSHHLHVVGETELEQLQKGSLEDLDLAPAVAPLTPLQELAQSQRSEAHQLVVQPLRKKMRLLSRTLVLVMWRILTAKNLERSIL